MLPRTARARSREVLEQEWGTGLIRSWNAAGWFDLPSRLGDKLGRLIGAGPGEVVVTDTTSLNLFKALAAALRIQQASRPHRRVIVSERDNFPTDLYMAQGMIDFLQRGYELRLIDAEHPLEQAVGADETAVLLLSHVNYRTGAMHDMAATTAFAHRHGAADHLGSRAFGRRGAGGPAGCRRGLRGGLHLQVPEWRSRVRRRSSGSRRGIRTVSGSRYPAGGATTRPFAMTADYQPARGIRRFLCGTQPVLSMALVECGLDVALQADMADVRAKSLALTDLFIHLVETRCAAHPLTLITPRDHAARGSHVSLRHPNGYAVMQALIARGVIGDYREPEVLRFGITPLYLGHADIWDAVETLRDILDSRAWDTPEYFHRATVT